MTAPEILQLEVLYQDEMLVAIHKPAWAVVHKTRGAKGALILVDALAQQLGLPIFPVHRLDRQTSGVMVFALSRQAASAMGGHVREGAWRKSYLGLCRGVIEHAVSVERDVPEGEHRRPARTFVEPLEVLCGRYTFLRFTPHTGRRHQIRYHMKNLRSPLVCDVNYGDGKVNRFFRETFNLQRMFLHAESLKFPHPVEARRVELSAAMPDELGRVLEELREYEGEVA